MLKKITAIYIFFINALFAGAMGTESNNQLPPLYLGVYGGYGHFDSTYKSDGNYAQGRLAFGVQLKQMANNSIGLELGLQSGNSMRLDGSEQLLNSAYGTPAITPLANLKPVIDGLATIRGKFKSDCTLFYLLKGGIAYRQLHLEDRTSSRDTLNEIAPEMQVGVGMNITSNMVATIFYQGIYSNSNVGIGIDAVADTTIQHIPTQQAGFIGLEYFFN